MGKNYFEKFLSDNAILFKYDPRNIDRNVSFYVRDLLMKTNHMMRYGNLPETIKQRDLNLLNQTHGFSVWLPHEGKLYALESSIGSRLNQNYEPTRAIGANPYLNYSWDLEIGKECVLMNNDSLRNGLIPVIVKYGTLLAHNELSLYMLQIVSRAQKILVASDTNNIQSAKMWIDGLEHGDIGVVVDPQFIEDIAGLSSVDYTSSNANADILKNIEVEQYLKGTLYGELGIRTTFNMKREALGDTEITEADKSIYPRVEDMLACQQTAVDQINELFSEYLPGTLTVDVDDSWAREFEMAEARVEQAFAEAEGQQAEEEPQEEEKSDAESEPEDNR